MRATTLATAAIVALASHANAETIRIDVGQNNALTFSPDTVTAKVGDILDFHFHAVNHSVVMGDFANPCAPAKTGGFYSGFMPVSGSGEADETFQVTVNSTDPIFFYCAQNKFTHCKSGMSGVVNPSGGNTLAAYQSAAKNVASASNPPTVFGGRLVTAESSTTTTSAAPAATTSCTVTSKTGNGSGYKRSDTCSSGAGSVQVSLGIVAAFTFGMAILLS